MKEQTNPCVPSSIDILDLHHIAIGSGCVTVDATLASTKDIESADNSITSNDMKTNIKASINKRTIDMAVFSFLFSVLIFCFSALVFTDKNEGKAIKKVDVKTIFIRLMDRLA